MRLKKASTEGGSWNWKMGCTRARARGREADRRRPRGRETRVGTQPNRCAATLPRRATPRLFSLHPTSPHPIRYLVDTQRGAIAAPHQTREKMAVRVTRSLAHITRPKYKRHGNVAYHSITRNPRLSSPGLFFSTQPALSPKKGSSSYGVQLTPVPQAGVPIPPIRPLLCRPLNYFFSLLGLPTRRDATRRIATHHVIVAKIPESNNEHRTFNLKSFSRSMPLYIHTSSLLRLTNSYLTYRGTMYRHIRSFRRSIYAIDNPTYYLQKLFTEGNVGI